MYMLTASRTMLDFHPVENQVIRCMAAIPIGQRERPAPTVLSRRSRGIAPVSDPVDGLHRLLELSAARGMPPLLNESGQIIEISFNSRAYGQILSASRYSFNATKTERRYQHA
jgi:hypothetical protein